MNFTRVIQYSLQTADLKLSIFTLQHTSTRWQCLPRDYQYYTISATYIKGGRLYQFHILQQLKYFLYMMTAVQLIKKAFQTLLFLNSGLGPRFDVKVVKYQLYFRHQVFYYQHKVSMYQIFMFKNIGSLEQQFETITRVNKVLNIAERGGIVYMYDSSYQ